MAVVVEAEEEWEVLVAAMAVAAAITVDTAAATAAVTVVACLGRPHRPPGRGPRPVEETTPVGPRPAPSEAGLRVAWASRVSAADLPADRAERSQESRPAIVPPPDK